MDRLQPFRYGKNCGQRCKESKNPPLGVLLNDVNWTTDPSIVIEALRLLSPNVHKFGHLACVGHR